MNLIFSVARSGGTQRSRGFGLLPALLLLCLRGLSPQDAFGAGSHRRDWTVDGMSREALVVLPERPPSDKGAPLVFVFHGHGGSMQNAQRSFHLHTVWPEAIVVYPQGLKTPGQLTDPQGRRAGWQHAPGTQGDRDLKFFQQVSGPR
ncbi:MAG: hypothetical protein H7A46_13650 [Verrucomicrobiales bacterium]|nr:hypothetical protein [Verrucomicrobiales bacterium]